MSFYDGRPAQNRRQGHGRDGVRRFQELRSGQMDGGSGPTPHDTDLCLMILALLAEQPRTGFVTMQILAARSCVLGVAGGMLVYPALLLLEDTGLVSAASDECGRSVYSLTDAGSVELAAQHRHTDAIVPDANMTVRQTEPSGSQPCCCQRTIAAIVASGTRASSGTLGVESTSATRTLT